LVRVDENFFKRSFEELRASCSKFELNIEENNSIADNHVPDKFTISTKVNGYSVMQFYCFTGILSLPNAPNALKS
jgi:hypothetical protein